MSSPSSEQPSDGDESQSRGPRISIYIFSKMTDEVCFSFKPTLKMGILFDTFALKIGADAGSLCFRLYGEKVSPHATPEQMELQDGVRIECTYKYAAF